MQSILIHTDATPSIGAGHIMRCLALAQAACDMGIPVRFLGRIDLEWVRNRLAEEKMEILSIPDPVPAREDPEQLFFALREAGNTSWLVLDGYHFGPDCHKAVQDAGYKLLVIDDYAHLPEYHCDLLLNQNLDAENFTYHGRIGTKLLGPQFVLLRREFVNARKLAEARSISDPVRHILLTLGGGDFSEMLFSLAAQFMLPELQKCTLRILAGGMPSKKIELAFADCPARVEILQHVTNMPELMLWADLCVTAGGSTCWELCCLGIPFLTVEVAPNQHEIIQSLEQNRIAPRFTSERLGAQLKGTRTFQTEKAHIDGQGASRVLSFLLEQG